MKEDLVLFDWDDTLFSKKKFKKNLSDNLGNVCGVDGSEILDLEEKYIDRLKRSDDFRIDVFLRYLESKFGKEINTEDFTSDNLKIYSKSLFPDTIQVLEELKANSKKLGLYTKGFEYIQMYKIIGSGISSYFDKKHIYIDRDKEKDSYIEQIPSATVVEDKASIARKLGTIKKFKVIRIDLFGDNEVIPNVNSVPRLREVLPQILGKDRQSRKVV